MSAMTEKTAYLQRWWLTSYLELYAKHGRKADTALVANLDVSGVMTSDCLQSHEAQVKEYLLHHQSPADLKTFEKALRDFNFMWSVINKEHVLVTGGAHPTNADTLFDLRDTLAPVRHSKHQMGRIDAWRASYREYMKGMDLRSPTRTGV